MNDMTSNFAADPNVEGVAANFALLQGVYVLVFLGAAWANFMTKDVTD